MSTSRRGRTSRTTRRTEPVSVASCAVASTRLVDRIESAGLVRREPVPGDRRGVRVVLTADGKQRYTVAIARHWEVIEREFGRRLTPSQHRAVADALWPWWHHADPADSPDAG